MNQRRTNQMSLCASRCAPFSFVFSFSVSLQPAPMVSSGCFNLNDHFRAFVCSFKEWPFRYLIRQKRLTGDACSWNGCASSIFMHGKMIMQMQNQLIDHQIFNNFRCRRNPIPFCILLVCEWHLIRFQRIILEEEEEEEECGFLVLRSIRNMCS